MRPRSRRTPLLLGVAGLSLTAVILALMTQHLMGMQPCSWCILQRLIFVLIALATLPGLLWQAAAAQAFGAFAVLALSLCGAAAALWQHFVAAASASCNLTLADRIISGLGLDGSLPEIFQPRASCADAAVQLLGLPYEFWSLALFVLFSAAALRRLADLRG